ncbi:MAG: chromosomal replication initiator protein DnaA [Deltaproteobacteria bacterium]|nr:chromosomal replication initiator protein DnaA [Deltaproteobacteria bacterium]
MIELWGEAVRSIEPMVKPAHRNLWLRPIECISIVEGKIRLRAPNRYHKEWFEDHFLPSILRDLENRTLQTFTVEFEIEEEPRPAGVSQRSGDMPVASATRMELPAHAKPPSLLSRYAFEKFVVGPTNRFAYSASQSVAESPGEKYNPLFIYGGVGVGKTHLLQAIGHEIYRQHPEWNVVFVTCERFVTDFISSLMNRGGGANQMEEFRARYREFPDVLLIDDIQFLSNKDSSQDEFFHTFNALHYAHKQIVMTCDKLPSEVAGLEDRLRSRFTWGLIAEVGTPDLETRVAIVKRKAELDRIDLPDEVALFIGTAIKTNVRDLEGALARVSARASFESRPLTLELAQDALKNIVASSPVGLTIEAVQREVSTYFSVKLADLKGPKRHRAVAHPRAIAMYLARKLTAMSYPEIGSRFGGKDHSTVISAVRKIERMVKDDAAQRSIVTTLESHLRDI